MGSIAALDELMRRIGLDQTETDERCRLLEWQAGDAAGLTVEAASMESAQRAFVKRG